MSSKGEESVPRSMREIVQKRFSEEVIGNAATTGSGWMVLVMDDAATRVISSALTMYDIMEQRVTLVEQLAKSRQPFKEMDVVYMVSPTIEAANQISADFENDKKSKYGGVHIYFLDLVSKHSLLCFLCVCVCVCVCVAIVLFLLTWVFVVLYLCAHSFIDRHI
jgi:hypothetical protein